MRTIPRIISEERVGWHAAARIQEKEASPINKSNVAYICIFLRNAGERFRAIVLAKDVFGIPTAEARDWVDSVNFTRKRIDNSKARAVFAEYPTYSIDPTQLEDGFEIEVSHFPNPPNPSH